MSIEIRNVLFAAQGSLADLALEADNLTEITTGRRDGSSRLAVRRAAAAVDAALEASGRMATVAADTSFLPDCVSVTTHANRCAGLRNFAGDVDGLRKILQEIISVCDVSRFQPRARRLRAMELIVRLSWEIRHLDRSLAALWAGEP